MKKVLVICHVEPYFKCIPHDLPGKIANYARLFDDVIVIESASEFDPNRGIFDELYHFNSETWLWGFEPDKDSVLGIDYIETKNSAHYYAVIEDWMKSLPKRDHKYYLVGGAIGECLQDISEIFSHLGINHITVDSLTYGE